MLLLSQGVDKIHTRMTVRISDKEFTLLYLMTLIHKLVMKSIHTFFKKSFDFYFSLCKNSICFYAHQKFDMTRFSDTTSKVSMIWGVIQFVPYNHVEGICLPSDIYFAPSSIGIFPKTTTLQSQQRRSMPSPFR